MCDKSILYKFQIKKGIVIPANFDALKEICHFFQTESKISCSSNHLELVNGFICYK